MVDIPLFYFLTLLCFLLFFLLPCFALILDSRFLFCFIFLKYILLFCFDFQVVVELLECREVELAKEMLRNAPPLQVGRLAWLLSQHNSAPDAPALYSLRACAHPPARAFHFK